MSIREEVLRLRQIEEESRAAREKLQSSCREHHYKVVKLAAKGDRWQEVRLECVHCFRVAHATTPDDYPL